MHPSNSLSTYLAISLPFQLVLDLSLQAACCPSKLHHPQAQDPLRPPRKTAPWTERLLDDLLLLADAHGCFRQALLVLKQLLAEAHAALRRRDATRLAAELRARHRSDRDLSRLASTLRDLSYRSSSAAAASDFGETALAEAVEAATCAAAAASASIFAGLASASASSARLGLGTRPRRRLGA
ncbi:hypothetical protein E2562_032974 [Oryza meyeriana var. granulata]|uniref:Uncharacterized protein n=1 Tax=Oryza meyeriana var. granulata TaxID=110450 RepID=A0A6G1D937_9ORYZ|nr:hypothetical protein E2562_032974 [Oryza meyeriana var. granulata]